MLLPLAWALVLGIAAGIVAHRCGEEPSSSDTEGHASVGAGLAPRTTSSYFPR